MHKKAVKVPTAEFLENDNLDAKYFYLPSLNGMVKKCPHGLFEILTEDNFKPIRCKYCNAKLLPNEMNTTGSSYICCMNGQIKIEGKPWQIKKLSDPPDIIKELFSGRGDPHFMPNIRNR